MGFMFWINPVYSGGRFIGSIIGSGYLEADKADVCDQMRRLCKGEMSEAELMKKIESIPQGDPNRIKSFSELMLICAESLSSGESDHHIVMRRRSLQQSKLLAKIEELKNKYPAEGTRLEYPMDKERELLEALRRGDTQTGRGILNELLAVLHFSNPNQFKNIQYRAIELAILISRIGAGPGLTSEILLEANNKYLDSIQAACNIEELTDALYRIVDDVAAHVFSFQGARHASALKKAEYFILENFTRKISLNEIANASGFSTPYFSTIFKEEMGENFSSYLNRLRVEKASYLLVHTNHSLNNITRACGFEDQSWFSKIFKAYTGISPRKYRNQGGKPSDNHHQEMAK
jgi:YesN/AraC family two-component response regulator